MNNLSWMIYLAGVCDSLRVVCGVSFILVGMAVVGTFIVLMASSGEIHPSKRAIAVAVFVVFMVCLVRALVPSERTVYLIAASEAGQQVAQSDAGKELLTETQRILLNKLRQYGKDEGK